MHDVRDQIQALIFGFEDTAVDTDNDEREHDPAADGTFQCTRDSEYVAVIERAITGIVGSEDERKLFDEPERAFLRRIAELSYSLRYVLIRLVLRKKAWYRLSDVRKYTMEVGEKALREAFEKLSQPLELQDEYMHAESERPPPAALQPSEREIIDLTIDSDDEDIKPPVAGPSRLEPAAPVSNPTDDSDEICMDYFGRDENHMGLLDGLRLLNMDELKAIAKVLKIQSTNKTKDNLITALMNSASGQSLLAFAPSPQGKGKGKQRDTKLQQTVLPFTAPSRSRIQTERLRELMLKAVDKTIRLNPYVYTLILRVHIIWFRSTEIPESLFSPALLATFKKRTYAEYEHKRDPTIWKTREAYLDYEEMLNIEHIVDELLKPEPKAIRGKTPAPSQVFIPPGTPNLDYIRKLSTPARTPGLREVSGLPPDADDEPDDNPAHRKANVIMKLVKDRLLRQYKLLVAALEDQADARKPEFLRFESGYVLTRILAKCLHAAATLKDFFFEEEIILLLLSQRRWGRRRRGRLYDRLALIRMRYLCKDEEGKKDMDVVHAAQSCLIKALADPDSPMVLKPSLIHRLIAAEKMLRLPTDKRATYEDVTLQRPPEADLIAVRVWDLPDSDKAEKENKTADSPNIQSFFLPSRGAGPPRAVAAEAKKRSWTGKSYWQGKDDVVHVEIRAIEYYQEQGFKGLHSETQILTTLFGLLFWDIIFAPVAGAFETPWQMGPLDLAEESFYFAREELIKKRLAEIDAGEARTILEANDVRYRENKTSCVGVNWQMCGRDDLLEIVECFGPHVLASICRLFCEDYAGRSSGVPDLIIWNAETKEFKFVEVKGPGDSLHDNQKLWCHALITADCQVELLHVMEAKDMEKKQAKLAAKEAKTKTPKPRKPRASGSAGSRSKAKSRADIQPESEDEGSYPEMGVGDDEEAWLPEAHIAELLPDGESPPRRRSKRRRSEEGHKVEDDDEPETPLVSRAKRRKTI
ncbi:VRR-NUC domain-containing protein [Mycena amicta]|nr:VRR-NUC domain-containing protein [Mycena amicta]